MLTFKTPNERDEWSQLLNKNIGLFDLIIDLTAYVDDKYGKDVVLTSVYRDAAEQNQLYKDEPKKVPNTPHSTWEAVDLRSSIYSEQERAEICEYLNKKYKNANGKKVAFVHAVTGGALHFHVALYR